MVGVESVTIDLARSKDGSTVVLSIVKSGVKLAYATMGAPELEGLIQALGQVRAKMSEIVPLETEPHAISNPLQDPAWRVLAPRDPPFPALVLTFRHQGFGWINALLPLNGARLLAESLSDVADALDTAA